MANHGTILLVSGSPGLNKVLETIASTYSLSLVTTVSAKAGLVAFKQTVPDCVIFDARLLRDHKRVELVREKIESKGVPVLFLSADSPGASRTSGVRSSFSLEPVIKFVSVQSDRLKALRPSGFWSRFTSRPQTKALQH
jgi:DNA-binding NtrC family response regulator